MKDPRPLLDDGATELELRLLRAGNADGPSVEAHQAALAALGLSSAALSISSSAGAAAGGAALASEARVVATKWWALGALVVTAGAAGVGYVTGAGEPANRTSAVVGPRHSAAPVVATAVKPPRPDVPVAPSATVMPPRERRTAAPSHPATSAGGASSPGIQEQIAVIDRARAAVAAHQPTAALVALDEYQRRFPAGVLTQEAMLLRIDALLARGDKASAARLGRQFLERYPRSPMTARVKASTEG